MAISSDESGAFRRAMRDLVALSALPAVWVDYQPRQVAESLADVLLSTLRLDLVYVCLRGETDGLEIEFCRTAGPPTTPSQLQDIRTALAPWLEGIRTNSPPVIQNPVGDGTIHLHIAPIGLDRHHGILIVGSQQTAFPSEEDRLLLSVATNQAAAVLQRLRAEEALRESHSLLSAVIEGTPDAVFVKDTRGRYILINTAGARIVGRRPEEVLGKDDTELFELETARAFRETDRRVLEGGGVVTYEDTIIAGGVTRAYVTTKGAHRDSQGRPLGVFGVARDITERKRDEEALRESNERFRIVTLATNDAVWDWDMKRNKVWWNDGVLTLFGYHLETNQADPDWWLERIHPEDREAVAAYHFEVVRGKEHFWVDEYRFRCADGSYKDVQDRGYVLRDTEGRATRMIGAMLDITDRKRAEEALRESERRFRTLAEALPCMVWTAEPDGTIDYLSPRTVEYLGLTLEQIRSTNRGSTLHPEDRQRCIEQWMRSVATGEPYEVEYRHRRADGAFRWQLGRALPLRDESGRITKWFGAILDIDDQKRAEEALRQAKEVAEAANRAKDEFLANVSHEIRTPMNAILGMTELALDTPLTDDQRQCLQTVKSAADNLLGLINELLDFAKIEAGKLELVPADFSVRATVRDTLRALATRAHKKGLELACNVQPDVPDALVGDAGRLRQVLLNLVGNAIKFTEHGEVVVNVTEMRDEGRGMKEDKESDFLIPHSSSLIPLRFEVRDTGIGIPSGKQERIFRAFEQEDTSTTRRYGGTGLGLTIAARLAELMGGSITVQSEPGRGSTFVFTAQFERQLDPPEQTVAWLPVLLKGLRVLVVDDNPTNRHILEEWLTGWQMESMAVGDGLAALGALWDAVSIGRPYPLVLLDARMPDTDGLALAARIRERAALSAIRIILLTSDHHRPGDLAHARELRIDAQLLKPVQQDELLETIYRVMTRAQGDAPTAVEEPVQEPGTVAAATPLQILLAEDDEFSAQVMDKLLARRGHRVRLASNGREALALAGQGVFDVMLLDVHLPELDGIAVVRGIREHERVAGGHLPVIALTARSRKEDRERCLAAGMDDFLTKPVSAADLFAVIDRLVPGHGVSRTVPPETGKHLGLLDPVAVLAACDDNAEALRSMCVALETYLPVRLTEVAGALRAKDAPRLREAAHKLSALLFAFSQTAGQAASELEAQAAQGRLEEARLLVAQLETMAQELMGVVGGLSLETLRQQRVPAHSADRISKTSTG